MKTYPINYDTIPSIRYKSPHDKTHIEETVFTVGFMSRFGFVPKIRSGEKGITIRKPRKDGKLPQRGQIMRMWADQRTAKRERIFKPGELEPRCTGVYEIFVDNFREGFQLWSPIVPLIFPEIKKRLKRHCVSPNNIAYTKNTKNIEYLEIINQFARLDGWNTPEEMFQFFKDSLPFKGFVYCWVKL